VLIKKAFLIKHNLKYSSNFKNFAEDLILWHKLFENGARFGNIPKFLLKYRLNHDSISFNNKEIIKIANKLNQYRALEIPLNICIQVNISDENTKSGISLNDVNQFAKVISNLKNLKLRGVMAIPSKVNEGQALISQYKSLRDLYEKLKISYSSVDTLSIGMSSDYLLAIENGANLVRIGTKIFGAR
jgi:pyridoxal phosphate enzyme (YggS family)